MDFIDKKYFKMALSGPFRETHNDIAVRCPICGDSQYKRNSKRLHLFHKDNKTRVKCFNGGCKCESPMNLGYFLKLYYPQFFEAYKSEKYYAKLEAIKSQKTPEVETIQSFLPTTPTQTQTPKTLQAPKTLPSVEQVISSITGIDEKTKAFLFSRGLNYANLQRVFGDFYTGTKAFMFEGKYYDLRNTLFIPIFTKKSPDLKDMVGFYSRDISTKRFVNNALAGHFIPWNLNKIDNGKKVYIFEAILDALSFYQLYGESNIIALCTNNINPKVLEYLNHPVFCLDNDTVGIQTMLKYTQNKRGEFLIYPQGLEYKDFNEILLSGSKIPLQFETSNKANILLRYSL